MKVSVVLEERFFTLSDGRFFSPNGFGDDFWKRYLEVFSKVVIVARSKRVAEIDPNWIEITNPNVTLRPVTYYIGVRGFVKKMISVWRTLKDALSVAEVIIVRAPGNLALMSDLYFRIYKSVYAVELVGDPVDVFGAGIGGRLSRFLAVVFSRSTRSLCAHANAVSYVTQKKLQSIYPIKHGGLSIGCSSVELRPDAFVAVPRNNIRDTDATTDPTPTIFCAGSLEVPYKGVDILLEAVAKIRNSGVQVSAVIAGDGRLRPTLEAQAVVLGIAANVKFLGRVNRKDVLGHMKACTVYVQPSLTEGLPRAVIEASAVAAPIIATKVGGIPELLIEEDMVPPGDAEKLAQSLLDVLKDKSRMQVMSARNLEIAQNYSSDILQTRRRNFYSNLRIIATRKVKDTL